MDVGASVLKSVAFTEDGQQVANVTHDLGIPSESKPGGIPSMGQGVNLEDHCTTVEEATRCVVETGVEYKRPWHWAVFA